MKLKLTPNINSKYIVHGTFETETKEWYEMIEISCHPSGPPQGLIHIDTFYEYDDRTLYSLLLQGNVVVVDVIPVEDNSET